MTDYCMTDDDDVYVHDDCHTGCHPVLVLDPDDTEQMGLFAHAHWIALPTSPAQRNVRMAAAVRSMLTPPKIAEPTNRYAVVVDRDGVEWVRLTSGYWKCEKWDLPWKWTDIDAVRVLQDGVSGHE